VTTIREDGGNMEAAGEDSGKQDYFDYDSYWKSLIEKYLYPLLKRAVPELYEKADTSKEPRPLDKEFQDILNTGDPKIHKRSRFADHVAEVPLKDGNAEWVLFHAEAQGKGGGDLAERMNHYRCLIYAHYRKEPVALAIVTDKRPKGEASFYSHSFCGTKSVYQYNNLVLTDLSDEELLTSDNPIDLVLYAAKQAVLSREDLRRYNYLRTITGLLAERGWDMEEKRGLLLFIERILYLEDESLSARYREYLQRLKEEGKMVYIPFYERSDAEKVRREGRQEGRQEGKEEMAREMARNLLANGIPLDVIAKSAGLPLDKIQTLVN
jgi:predicted transposase YdaD